jgi:hypothetical protein
MGYAGYAPGANSRAAEALSEYERALRSLPLDKWEETLELIEKLTRNVVRNPREDKFRKIRLTNKKISEFITEVPGATELLRVMGWTDATSEEGEACLVLPDAVTLEFQEHVGKIVDAKPWYKKEVEDAKRAQARQERIEADPALKALKEKMDQDRAEVAAKGPAQASVAKKLGDGPNIMRAGDVGIGQSSGG